MGFRSTLTTTHDYKNNFRIMPTWIILGGDNVQPSWRRPHSFHIGNPVAIRRHRGP